MERWLGSHSDKFYALFRIIAGLAFAQHGAQKLFGALGGTPADNPMMMVAGIIEFVGGLMVAFGVFTSIAAFIAAGQMAVAYFMVHFPNNFWPIQNQGELAMVYCFAFLYIASRGTVQWGAMGNAPRSV